MAACARPVGDFGRAEDDPLHYGLQSIVRGAGELTAPGSVFNLTDEEQEMRDRVWRYLVAPQAYDWFGDVAVELRRIGFAPPGVKPPPKDRYYLWLHGTVFASSRGRYSRLADDVRADLDTMPSTFASICKVEGIDRQRDIAANGLAGIEARTRQGSAAQHAENRAVIGWFAAAVNSRYQSYSYALDHLLIETPHEGAMQVDADLSNFEIFVEAAKRDDFCSADFAAPAHEAGPGPGSRYLRPAVSGLGS